ncbi:hypothetical protein O3P69_009972 [Scylla paramamosain]|uniref:Uncharacterized protein n=1 Tax=Scylla paramamosain TaxID=85552 RepID=A0AAW0SPM4_SCYPA
MEQANKHFILRTAERISFRFDIYLGDAGVKTEVQSEINQVKAELQHREIVARTLSGVVGQLGDRRTTLEASGATVSVFVVAGLTEAVKHLEDRVSAVELSDGQVQQVLRDLVNVKTEYGGEEAAEGREWDGRSISTGLGDDLAMAGQVAQPSVDQPGTVKLRTDPRRPARGSSVDSAGHVPNRVTSNKTAQRRPPPHGHSPNLQNKEGNTDDPCLLDLDYLLESRACLNFGEMRMEVQGKEVPLLKANASTPVVAAKTNFAEWTAGQKDTGDEQVRVLVANLGDEERQIPVGSAVGSCEAVELAYEAPGSGFKKMAVTHGLSAHLEDL